MLRPTNSNLYNYWNTIRNGRSAPKRYEIAPSDISHLLPETMIIEIGQEDTYRVRLAGTKICRYFGREFRDQNIFDFFPAEDRDAAINTVNALKIKGAVITLQFSAQNSKHQTIMFEMLLLPMIHSGHKINRILGSITPFEHVSWSPEHPISFGAIESIHTILLRNGDGFPSTLLPNSGSENTEKGRLFTYKNMNLRIFDGGKTDHFS